MTNQTTMAQAALAILDNTGEYSMSDYILQNAKPAIPDTQTITTITILTDGSAIRQTDGIYSFAWMEPTGIKTAQRKAFLPAGHNHFPQERPVPIYNWPDSESLYFKLMDIIEEEVHDHLAVQRHPGNDPLLDETESHIIAPSLRETMADLIATFDISDRLHDLIHEETRRLAHTVLRTLPDEEAKLIADEVSRRITPQD